MLDKICFVAPCCSATTVGLDSAAGGTKASFIVHPPPPPGCIHNVERFNLVYFRVSFPGHLWSTPDGLVIAIHQCSPHFKPVRRLRVRHCGQVPTAQAAKPNTGRKYTHYIQLGGERRRLYRCRARTIATSLVHCQVTWICTPPRRASTFPIRTVVLPCQTRVLPAFTFANHRRMDTSQRPIKLDVQI